MSGTQAYRMAMRLTGVDPAAWHDIATSYSDEGAQDKAGPGRLLYAGFEMPGTTILIVQTAFPSAKARAEAALQPVDPFLAAQQYRIGCHLALANSAEREKRAQRRIEQAGGFAPYLTKRLAAIGLSARALSYRSMRIGMVKPGVLVSGVRLEAIVDVTDPELANAALLSGWGAHKAFGCGLIHHQTSPGGSEQ